LFWNEIIAVTILENCHLILMTTNIVKFKEKLNTGLHETSFHLVNYS